MQRQESPNRTEVYTDGACKGNPGPGGWAWAVLGEQWAYGHADHTTNQRMEIQAAYEAVKALDGPLRVVSDSTYVVNCFRDQWWKGWLKRGWKNAQKEPVANRDLWEPFIELVQSRDVEFAWVKGHSGDPMNDLVDRLAVVAATSQVGQTGTGVPPVDELEASAGIGKSALARATRGATKVAARTNIAATTDSDGAVSQSAAIQDSRIPQGHLMAVGGARGAQETDAPFGRAIQEKLVEIIVAHQQMYPDLVVLSGLRQGAEQAGARAARTASVPYVVVLPYPDPARSWSPEDQEVFEELCEAAASVVTLERKIPATNADKKKSLARRDGWLRSVSSGAIIMTNEQDKASQDLHRRFVDVLGDEVWELQV